MFHISIWGGLELRLGGLSPPKRPVAMGLRPGRLLACIPPLSNSSLEQWHTVVNVTGYTLFVTSQCNDILTFGEVC